jgi:murein DD-endopeptidase MepM/ murein hydrolase activator NlpD
MYAHLSRIDVRTGVWIGQGVRVGLVGASGHATGPHLHFEVRVRGASVDPLRALP